jgi:RNA polymerase sigma-70 factor (ECF subfamily)
MVPSTHPAPLSAAQPISARRRQRAASKTESLLDEVLVRAQAGNQDAFSQLYLLHNKRVFRICLRMVRDLSVAEDLTQETFLQLHRKLASFRGESAFTTWLHRMTVNIVLMRKRKRVLPIVSLDQLMTTVPEDYVGRDFGKCDLKQTSVVDRVTIQRAVDSLPPGYRKIYLLHDVRGLDHHEIAAMEGCSLGNSKSQLYKARRALRTALVVRKNHIHS